MSLKKTLVGFAFTGIGAAIAFGIAYWQTENLAAASAFSVLGASVVFPPLSHIGQFR